MEGIFVEMSRLGFAPEVWLRWTFDRIHVLLSGLARRREEAAARSERAHRG